MNKIVVGLMAGAVLGALDGATAWFTPEVRPVIGGILMGSTFKGVLVGVLSGWFARKVRSVKWGVVLGAALGLLFAYGVAAMDATAGKSHYVEIMLPGFVTGAIIGFSTQRAGEAARAREA